jgi:hypothetical protein
MNSEHQREVWRQTVKNERPKALGDPEFRLLIVETFELVRSHYASRRFWGAGRRMTYPLDVSLRWKPRRIGLPPFSHTIVLSPPYLA